MDNKIENAEHEQSSESIEDVDKFIQTYNNKIDIIDKFLQIHNIKYNTNGSLFEGINDKDQCSTNEKMELFYEYMIEHASLEKENPSFIDVYEPNVTIDNESCDIYTLVKGKNREIKYISLSFISLLYIGVSEFSLTNDWNIVRM